MPSLSVLQASIWIPVTCGLTYEGEKQIAEFPNLDLSTHSIPFLPLQYPPWSSSRPCYFEYTSDTKLPRFKNYPFTALLMEIWCLKLIYTNYWKNFYFACKRKNINNASDCLLDHVHYVLKMSLPGFWWQKCFTSSAQDAVTSYKKKERMKVGYF